MNWKFDHRQLGADRTGEVAPNRRVDDARATGPLLWESPARDNQAAVAQSALDHLRKYEVYGETCVRLNDAKALFQPGSSTLCSMVGRVVEVGNLNGDNLAGVCIDTGDGNYLTVTGLTQEMARAVAILYGEKVHVVFQPIPHGEEDDQTNN